MAVASSGSISIKTAAGSGRSIDTDGRTDISSGSLVTLSTGDVVTSGNTIDGSAPHGMREFLGYQHIIDQSVTETWTLRNSDNSGTAAWIHSTTTSGQGAYPCSAGADFRIYPHTYYSGGLKFRIYVYIRSNIWANNDSGAYPAAHRKSYTPSQTWSRSGGSELSGSTWTYAGKFDFGATANKPDTMRMNVSHSTTTSGSGGFGDGSTTYDNGASSSYNFNPVGTFTSITNNVYYYLGETYTTWNECSDFNAARTSTYTFEFQRSGNYANYITKGIKIRNENSHRQVGFC
jgi:hypothetical protein